MTDTLLHDNETTPAAGDQSAQQTQSVSTAPEASAVPAPVTGKVDPAATISDRVPAKFKDPQTGALRLEALIESYLALEKKMSRLPSVPATPEDYCVECRHGLFESDPAVNKRLHEKGFSREQAQEVYDLAAEYMVPMISGMAADFQADREVEKLISHFGGADQWREVSRQLLAFGKKNLPADVLEGLAGSFEGVLALHKMMKGEVPAPSMGGKEGGQTAGAVNEADLKTMMRDPRYWRERDPSFVAKVTQGFESLFGQS